MSNVTVVIPVVQKDKALSLVRDIEGNTVRPGRLIIIDNSKDGFDPKSTLLITRVRPPENIGVNASWNFGVKLAGECKAVSILNDDICVGPHFFRQILEVLDKNPTCGVVCPQTATGLQGYQKFGKLNSPVVAAIMPHREGWAFTIRKSLADRIPPIPAEIKTFCGDDWYWYWTHHYKFYWFKAQTTVIYHYVGLTVIGLSCRDALKTDKQWFASWLGKQK